MPFVGVQNDGRGRGAQASGSSTRRKRRLFRNLLALETSFARTGTKKRSLRFGQSRLHRGDAMDVCLQHPPAEARNEDEARLMESELLGESKSGWDLSGEGFRGLSLLVGLLKGQIRSQVKFVMANGRVWQHSSKTELRLGSDTAGLSARVVAAPVAHQICTIKIGERISELRVAGLPGGGGPENTQ